MFARLPESDLSDLAGPLLTVHYPGGAVVTAQGKSKERFVIILRGKVKVSGMARRQSVGVRFPYATRLGHFAFWPLPSRGRIISA